MKKEIKISREDALNLVAKSSVYGNLGLFIGAGMSMAILNDSWNEIALSWKQLIFKCAEEFKITLNEDIKTEGLSYPEIATEIGKRIAKNDNTDYKTAISKLKRKIAELTSWYPESDKRLEYGNLLSEIAPSWIITTNYDLIIECLLTGKCLSLGPNDQLISPQNLIPVYHLHGIRTNPSSIIISQEDYISLFRPNQYRQQKLSLSIKESTTLIVGYGLGDVNVLTAVDWTKNVYTNQRINYPHDIIQLFYSTDPKNEPYRDRNGILIVEFNDLKEILSRIAVLTKEEFKRQSKIDEELDSINKIFSDPSGDAVTDFIDNESFRKSVIQTIEKHDIKLIAGFIELFSKAIDKTWERALPSGAFYAYNENLILILDILENISLSKLPPALFESLAYHLDRVSYYIGTSIGESRAAHKTWQERKDNIPLETVDELKNIAKSRYSIRLSKLWDK